MKNNNNNGQNQLLKMYKQVNEYYHRILRSPEGKTGYDFLIEKGLDDITIDKLSLGFSLDKSDSLYQYLKAEGFTDEILKLSDLFSENDNNELCDRFNNRIMIPIMDVDDNIIAFCGRTVDDVKPLYKSSNQTNIFDKNKNIYGLNLAKSSKSDYFILCEGIWDAIALYHAGLDNAIALISTTISQEQALLIAKLKKQVIISYDNDSYGKEASLRDKTVLEDAGIAVNVLELGSYKDTYEAINELGYDEFMEKIDGSVLG